MEKIEESDIDKALNTKGFAEFLAAHPDAGNFDMSNEGDVEKRFETFETKELMKKELIEIYSSHIEKEMGVKLDATDHASIDAYLESEAIENPEKLLDIKESMKRFKELPIEISNCEEQLGELGKAPNFKAELDALKKDQADLEIAKEYTGFFGKAAINLESFAMLAKMFPLAFHDLGLAKMEKYEKKHDEAANAHDDKVAAIRAVEEKYGKLKKDEAENILYGIRERIQTIEATLGAIDATQNYKEISEQLFTAYRKELLGGISNVKGLAKSIQLKVLGQFKAMTTHGNIKIMDNIQERFDALKKVAATTETGVNPLGQMKEEVVQERMNVVIEKAASEEIMKFVQKANLGTNALTNLEKVLEPYFKREKMGSRNKEETRRFVYETLELAAGNLGNSNVDQAKKLMIARILIKMKS